MIDDHKSVLRYLIRDTLPDGEMCRPFAPICKATKLSRRRVRIICRALARKGLAEYRSGLCFEDGGLAGAGYCITRPGIAFMTLNHPVRVAERKAA